MSRTKRALSTNTIALLLAFMGVQSSKAQTFQSQNNDLFLTFRKTGINQENYEALVDIGQASNYVNAAIGAKVVVRAFAPAQLSPGSFASLNNLSWSVVGYYLGSTYPGYPSYTLWVTVPRQNTSTKSTDAVRLDRLTQNTIRSKIASIASNAGFVSQDLGTSNQYNTVSFVRESISTYPTHLISVWMGSTVDNTIGSLNDTWPATEPNGGNLENTTPASFASSTISDLYEVRPLADAQGNPIVDPHTGTNGLAYYVGYFELKSDGTVTFTRDVASQTTPTPPAPQILSVTRSVATSTVNFTTTNGPTYTLYFTNAVGLSTPVTTWPASPTTVIGDGSNKSLSDTSVDPERFYRVGAR